MSKHAYSYLVEWVEGDREAFKDLDPMWVKAHLEGLAVRAGKGFPVEVRLASRFKDGVWDADVTTQVRQYFQEELTQVLLENYQNDESAHRQARSTFGGAK